MRITMIGHSTLLLEGAGVQLVTDPYFGRFGHIAYSRTHPAAMEREALRKVDGVLVSHSHWDHTDRKYLKSLAESVPVLAPSGTSLIMKLKGVKNYVPMKPWESHTIGGAVITAVPATHIARTIGFVVQMDGVTAWFAGDTYHRPFMKEIGRRFAIDVAMMPVATFRIPPTMGERGAAASARDIHPSVIIPIHLGIQPRNFLLRTSQTPATFEKRLRSLGIPGEVVHLREGEQWTSERREERAAAS